MADNELFGVMVATAGWSSDEEGDFNTILQSANLHLISKAECNSRLQMITGQHILTDLRIYQYSAVSAIIGQDVKQANLWDFPFAVVIMRIDNEQQVRKPYQTCTGSLISIRDVVTAGHCLDIDTLHLMQILVGSVDLSIGKRYFAAWWIVYNEWALYNNIIPEFPENDIGIIRLTRDVTEDLTPAVISFAPYIYTYPLTVTIAGWGKPSEDGESMMLTTVKLKTIQGSECEERLLNMYDLKVIADKRFLCSIGEPYALVTIVNP
ncbi:PREDICTED: uncharacterized protein LOC105360409 [Ceratosolen solmsi marchali]|uniref:Uncharacterized protein LOC105360409 n=1 Tax=Ceratosolen solmsi marchali TaxID=326594 RepID=A0AAJ6VNB0_9HYME|nr:PREDICTED: uncharacterized protein LOC105360409 [Ceratosolen solmsi marchali]